MKVRKIRSILYVPGDSPKKLAKTADVQADAFIVDWEDAVPDRNKQSARDATREAMPALAKLDAQVLVRINSHRAELLRSDCEAIRACPPDGIVMPKCPTFRAVEELLPELPDEVVIMPLLETPLGVVHAADIMRGSSRVKALLFGAEDYTAQMQIMRSPGDPELAYARSAVVNAARAFSGHAFDSPLMQYKDLDAVRDAAWRARRIGFSGQAAIHPNQVPVINDVFTPGKQEREDAENIVKRYQRHGGGVYGVDGELEDEPAFRKAVKLLTDRI